jgi:hypothetical protein
LTSRQASGVANERKGGCFMDNMPGMDMPMPDQNAEAEGQATGFHGMLIAGEETIYVSHLPMWMAPHNFQVILEVTFKGPHQPQARYVDDRKTTGTGLYTLEPEEFDIKKLAPTGPQRLPSLSSFRATIWRNHFEPHPVTHPGQRFMIAQDAKVHVENVVYFQELHPHGPGLQALEYLLFGKGQELFLAHVITQPPDFDQVLSVQVGNHQFTDEDLLQGVRVVFPGRANTISSKIKEGEPRIVGQDAAGGIDLPVAVGIELYFETEDLAMSM